MILKLITLLAITSSLNLNASHADEHVYLTDANFTEKMKDKDRIILVEVTASWCGWCKELQRNTFPEVIKTYGDQVRIYFVDADKQGRQWVAKKHLTYSLPGITLIRTGKVLARQHGYSEWARFSTWMTNGLNNVGEYEPNEQESTKSVLSAEEIAELIK